MGCGDDSDTNIGAGAQGGSGAHEAGTGGAGGLGGNGGTGAVAGAGGSAGAGSSHCPASLPTGMVYCEDFEDGDEQDTYGTNCEEYHDTFTGSTDVVTADCHESTYCLRGNLGNDGTPDAITGEPGAVNPHAEVGLGDVSYGSTANFDLSTIDTGEIAIAWWIKFDEDSLENLPPGKNHKMLYTNNAASEDYVILYTHNQGVLRLVVNGDNESGYPYTAGDDPQNSYQYGYDLNDGDGAVDIDDGQWHRLAIWMRYGTGQTADGAIRFWVDNALVLDVSDAWLIYTTGETMGSFALPSNWNALSATMSTLGWQVDDIQIWDRDPTM